MLLIFSTIISIMLFFFFFDWAENKNWNYIASDIIIKEEMCCTEKKKTFYDFKFAFLLHQLPLEPRGVCGRAGRTSLDLSTPSFGEAPPFTVSFTNSSDHHLFIQLNVIKVIFMFASMGKNPISLSTPVVFPFICPKDYQHST